MPAPTVTIEAWSPTASPPPDDVLDGFLMLEASNPQLGLDWLTLIASCSLEEDETPTIFIARGTDGNIAALPLVTTSAGHARALTSFYSSLYSPMSNGSQAEELFTALLTHLRKERGVHSMRLAPMDGEARGIELMRRALKAAGWRGIHTYFCFGNWYRTCEGMSWQTFSEALASRVRNTVRRKTRAFMREGFGALEIVTGGPELDAGIAAYNRVYAQSWKRDEPYPDFIPELLKLAADRGWLRLGLARYKGEAVAGQIWLVAGTTAYIFKLAYDEQFAHLSPGTVLTAHLMEHVLNVDRVGGMDYLSGDDAYKSDWMDERRERVGLAAYNCRTLRGVSGWIYYLLGALFRLPQVKSPQ